MPITHYEYGCRQVAEGGNVQAQNFWNEERTAEELKKALDQAGGDVELALKLMKRKFVQHLARR